MNGSLLSTLTIIIEGRLRLKLKKLDRRLRPKNILTQAVFEFMHQMELEIEDEQHGITNIIAGYRWDKKLSDMEGVYVVCPDGGANAWDISVNTSVIESDTPLTPVTPIRHVATTRKAVPRTKPAERKDGSEVSHD